MSKKSQTVKSSQTDNIRAPFKYDIMVVKISSIGSHLGYQNGTILAILNLHDAPMPSTISTQSDLLFRSI